MEWVVGARKLIGELVKDEQLELRRAEIVGRDLAQLVDKLGRPPSGGELEDWLDQHTQVTEVYAGPSRLEELVYRYLTPPPSEFANVGESRHPDLERQLGDADTSEPFLVYADWLQEHSDPLGELIVLGVAAMSGNDDEVARFERHLKLHEARFLGGLASQLANRVALRWRYGMVHAIDDLAEGFTLSMWEALLRLRVCEHVQSITLRRPVTPDLDARIAECAAQSLRALTLEGCHGRLPEHLMQRGMRTLAIAGPRIIVGPDTFPPGLQRLELRVDELSLEDEHAALQWSVRELDVLLTAAIASRLAGVQLPRLERLTLRLGAASAARAVALLEALELPTLAHLVICDGVLDPKAFRKLAKLPIAARLSSLALTNVDLTDERMESLARARGALESLAELDVSYNELSRDGLAIARKLAPNVISKRQHKAGNGMDRRLRKFAGSRLQVAEGIADPKAWRRAGVDGDLRWARYRGESEYDLFVTADLQRYGCTCPSSIQPCKHVVALALIAERTTLREKPSDGIELRVKQERGQRARYVLVEE